MKVVLEEREQLELQEQQRSQASVCKVYCKEEIVEVSRHHDTQKQTHHPIKLEEDTEVEAEELHDVEEGWRNQ